MGSSTSVKLVLKTADVSNGSLYHHFANKEELFEAVLDRVAADVADQPVRAAAGISDPAEALRTACQASLRMARDPVVRQIVLLDALAVRGWEKWREIGELHAFGFLKRDVEATLANGSTRRRQASPRVLLASIIEITMLIARADTPHKAVAAGEAALERLFTGMFGG